ncbi:Formamidopyrimidine-DNA glycosylase [Spathaspora sp. JA1]|nr:Formamidopyrimidine-DNA glycosylase [Spathaspora sp. JA1]
MPEVAEVAHVCAQLRRNILGLRIKSVLALNDPLIFPFLKQAIDADKELTQFKNKLIGCKVLNISRHGKYFWMRLSKDKRDKSIVLLMHFGMTGMIKLRDINSHLVFMENGGDKKRLAKLEAAKEDVEDEKIKWPPKFTKFEINFEKNENQVEFAFVDPRRLARIRLLEGSDIQTDLDLLNQPPLDVLGPDYSKPQLLVKQEPEFITGDPDPNNHGRPRLPLEEFKKLILTKKKPIKSLLLDQNHFAGIGNWVADEILFNAKIHPSEILSNKLTTKSDVVIGSLYETIIYVCETAVNVEGNVDEFPKNWLMLHRWGKSRKKSEKAKTNDGYTLDYVTVGGRTSCYSPEIQKLLKREAVNDEEPKVKKRKTKVKKE